MAHPPEAWTVGFDQLEVAEGQFVVQSNKGVREVLWTMDVPVSGDAERGQNLGRERNKETRRIRRRLVARITPPHPTKKRLGMIGAGLTKQCWCPTRRGVIGG